MGCLPAFMCPPLPAIHFPVAGSRAGLDFRQGLTACAKQSVASLLSVLKMSPSLKPECVSLCTRTQGWHFCRKEECKCKFTRIKLLSPHQTLPVVDCKLGNIAMNADRLPVKASLRGQRSPPRGSPWRWHQPPVKDTWSHGEGSHTVSCHCSALSYTFCFPK